MEIKRNGPEKGSGLQVTLAEGETLGNFIGPITISVPDAPGNKESDEIERLKKEGKVTIPDYVAPPPPVPQTISDRQFFHQLAKDGKITKQEALAAVKTGEIPLELQAVIDAIPDPDAQFDIEMLLSGATTFERNHPATAQLGAALGYDAAGLDELWTVASEI